MSKPRPYRATSKEAHESVKEDGRNKNIAESLVGSKFNRLLVVGRLSTINKRATWLCKCDCGNIKVVTGKHLRSGKVKSCGCYRSELTTKRYTKHGQSIAGNHTPEFTAWQNIKNRCYKPANSHYKYYGERGISVCDRWFHSFESFFADMGKRPSSKHSIDRVNNDGNYDPNNCRWATLIQQANNKRPRKIILQ